MNCQELLNSMKLEDFGAKMFVENAEEFAQLEGDAKAAFIARHAELVAGIRPASGYRFACEKTNFINLFSIFHFQ